MVNDLYNRSIPTLGGIRGFPGGTVVKNAPAKTGDIRDVGLIPGWEDPLVKGYPLRYSCLENPMNRGAWRATCPWGHKELDTTEVTQHACIPTPTLPFFLIIQVHLSYMTPLKIG